MDSFYRELKRVKQAHASNKTEKSEKQINGKFNMKFDIDENARDSESTQ